MNNQFCKQCGQANFPNAATCSKCGNALTGQANQNPFNAPQQEPPKTMMPNFQANNYPKPEKKSNTMFWVIGGVAVFLILAIGVVGIAAVGGFLYFNSSKTEVVKDDPPPKPRDDRNDDKPDSNDTSVLTDSQLEDFIKNTRSRVGRYKLDNVKPFKGSDFGGRNAGVTALYVNGSRRVVHSIAMFSSYDDASRDFNRYKRAIRSTKGYRVRSSQKDRIIFSYKGSVFLAFCNNAGGCHELISKNGNHILDYYDSYFGKS